MRVGEIMRSGQKPIVVVGSINIDLVVSTERIPVAGQTVLGDDFHVHPGGKGANQAVAVARLGYPVRMIGRLGEDAFGTQLRAHLEQEGIDIAGVAITPEASGVAMIVVSEKGENSIVVAPGANAQLSPKDLEANIEILRSAGLVLVQLEIQENTVEALGQICHRENIPLMLDPAPARALPSTLLSQVEWFTPNETEAAFFLEELGGDLPAADPAAKAKLLIGQGVKGVVLKMGERGAYLASATGLQETIDAFPVKAVDTTAAGDAFNGAFATGLSLHKGPVESARLAAAAAAISVTRAGAQPSMANMREVEELLKNGYRGTRAGGK
jgi:ribokinase